MRGKNIVHHFLFLHCIYQGLPYSSLEERWHMGRKRLEPEDRKVNVTIRLAPDDLKRLDEALENMNLVRAFLVGQALHVSIPANRTDLITDAIGAGLPGIAYPFKDMATELVQADLKRDEQFYLALDAFKERWSNSFQWSLLADAIEGARRQKKKSVGYEMRIKELEERLKEMETQVKKGK